MVTIRVTGASFIAWKYQQRRRAFTAWVDELLYLSLDEMQHLAGPEGYSSGKISLTQQFEYYQQHQKGMYGRGSAGQPDEVINPQNVRGAVQFRRFRPGGTTWLEGFRQYMLGGGATGEGRAQLHNIAWSTPYDAPNMLLVQAFRRGWQGPRALMRKRKIGAAIISDLPERMRPHYRRMLGSYLRMEMP